MPELRMDLVTQEWVVIATERSRRPHDFKKASEPSPLKPERVETCPFCPGNEGMTPPEVASFRSEGTQPDTPGWWVRTVPNKFPALAPQGDLIPRQAGIYTLTDAVGAHEVIIETPLHNQTPSTMPSAQWREAVRMYQQRIRTLAQDLRYRSILIFRNEGRTAGASLEHPHSQLVALPFIPPVLQTKLDGVARYYAQHGGSPYKVLLEHELTKRTRLVSESDHYVAFVPFAGRVPFETWVMPKTRLAPFAELEDSLRDEYANLVRETFQRIDKVLESPPYNAMLFTEPVNTNTNPLSIEHFYWHMRIVPRLTIDAGFEIGTGVGINITAPEDSARFLREVVLEASE